MRVVSVSPSSPSGCVHIRVSVCMYVWVREQPRRAKKSRDSQLLRAARRRERKRAGREDERGYGRSRGCRWLLLGGAFPGEVRAKLSYVAMHALQSYCAAQLGAPGLGGIFIKRTRVTRGR